MSGSKVHALFVSPVSQETPRACWHVSEAELRLWVTPQIAQGIRLGQDEPLLLSTTRVLLMRTERTLHLRSHSIFLPGPPSSLLLPASPRGFSDEETQANNEQGDDQMSWGWRGLLLQRGLWSPPQPRAMTVGPQNTPSCLPSAKLMSDK